MFSLSFFSENTVESNLKVKQQNYIREMAVFIFASKQQQKGAFITNLVID